MASGINIYSQLLISTIRIVDINNSNCCKWQLLISAIRIVDIYGKRNQHLFQIADIKNSNSW